MAAIRASFIPSFVSFATANNQVKTTEVAFVTARSGRERLSAATTIEALHFDELSKSIKVFGADGNLRECRIERLPNVEAGRTLWRKLQEAGKNKAEISFRAAGGFNPDRWFYDVE